MIVSSIPDNVMLEQLKAFINNSLELVHIFVGKFGYVSHSLLQISIDGSGVPLKRISMLTSVLHQTHKV